MWVVEWIDGVTRHQGEASSEHAAEARAAAIVRSGIRNVVVYEIDHPPDTHPAPDDHPTTHPEHEEQQ